MMLEIKGYKYLKSFPDTSEAELSVYKNLHFTVADISFIYIRNKRGPRISLNLTGLSLQVGAHIYAKATFIVFIIVTTVLVSIFVSFFIVGPLVVTLPDSSVLNGTSQSTANYSGFQLHTLEGNLLRKCWTCCLMPWFDIL